LATAVQTETKILQENDQMISDDITSEDAIAMEIMADDTDFFTEANRSARKAKKAERSAADIAEDIIRHLHIIYTNLGFYRWTEQHIWERIDDGVVLNLIAQHLDRSASGRGLSSILTVIKATAFRWWPFSQSLSNRVFVANPDLTFEKDTAGVWQFAVHDVDPEGFPLARLGAGYDAARHKEAPERFLGFLRRILVDADNRPLPDQAALIRLQQQQLGSCLIPLPDVKKGIFTFLWGPSDVGKSQLLNIIHAFIGSENCAYVTIDDLRDGFRQVALVGKLLHILWECPKGQLFPDEVIKMMADGCRQQVRAPYKEAVDAWITCKSIVATNHIIFFRDVTKSISNRLRIIRLDRPVPKSEQVPQLARSIVEDNDEMQRILGWAIDGLLDLLRTGEFVDPPSSRRAVDAWIGHSDVIGQFLAECCRREEPDSFDVLLVNKKRLYAVFREFCTESGHTKPYSKSSFEEALRERGIVDHPSRSTPQGRAYRGLALLEDGPPNPRCGDTVMSGISDRLSYAFGLDEAIDPNKMIN
jgi:P4 family phage/plasmid primase-like protien